MRSNGLSSSSLGRRYDNMTEEELCRRYVLENKEKERQRLERERAFDAGLIGQGGSIASEAGRIELLNHPDAIEARASRSCNQIGTLTLIYKLWKVILRCLAWIMQVTV